MGKIVRRMTLVFTFVFAFSCATSPSEQDPEHDPKTTVSENSSEPDELSEYGSQTIGFRWFPGDLYTVEHTIRMPRKNETVGTRCKYMMRVEEHPKGLVVRQYGLLPDPIPETTSHEEFNVLYGKFTCLLPDTVFKDGELVDVEPRDVDTIQARIRAYYEAHPERFEAGLGDKVATMYSAEALSARSEATWSRLVGPWVGRSVDELSSKREGTIEGVEIVAFEERPCVFYPDERCFHIDVRDGGDPAALRKFVGAVGGDVLDAERMIETTVNSQVNSLRPAFFRLNNRLDARVRREDGTVLKINNFSETTLKFVPMLAPESGELIEPEGLAPLFEALLSAHSKVASQLAKCRHDALIDDSRGTVVVDLIVAGDGSLTAVNVVENKVGKEAAACMTTAFEALSFEPHDHKEAILRLEYEF